MFNGAMCGGDVMCCAPVSVVCQLVYKWVDLANAEAVRRMRLPGWRISVGLFSECRVVRVDNWFGL